MRRALDDLPRPHRTLAPWFAALLLPFLWAADRAPGPPTFEERVESQRAVERVLWSHRTWPKENPGLKPSLDEVLPDEAIRAQVDEGLRKSAALEKFWRRPIEPSQLQAEMDRMAERSQDPAMLRELFAALHDDPALVAETLARPALADRLLRDWYAGDPRFHGEAMRQAAAGRERCGRAECLKGLGGEYRETTWRLRSSGRAVTDEATTLDAGEWRAFRERLVDLVGGTPEDLTLLTPGRVEQTFEGPSITTVLFQRSDRIRTATATWRQVPFDDWWRKERVSLSAAPEMATATYVLPQLQPGCTPGTWTATRVDHPPTARVGATSVWTGSELLVWGGNNSFTNAGVPRDGGRYNPATDTWTPLLWSSSVPLRRSGHTAVWTGTEMIVWGGVLADGSYTDTGGRYNASTGSWTPTAIIPATPAARARHAAVWTGTEMIVWGGGSSTSTNTGGRYDPVTDQWLATSTAGSAPGPRIDHAAVWTGNLMLMWGGAGPELGGWRYDPLLDVWTPMTFVNAPFGGRVGFSVVWSGTYLIVFGGTLAGQTPPSNTGGRYNPSADVWEALGGPVTPQARTGHTAVWTGTEMIVWGGQTVVGGITQYLNTGDIYTPAIGWSESTAIGPAARSGHVAAWTGTEMIVWGGKAATEMATGGRYTPSTDTWVPTSAGTAMPEARVVPRAVWTGAEMIVWGGRIQFPGSWVNSGGRYTPATDTWSLTSTGAGVPTIRSGGHAVWTGSHMIIWGGTDVAGNELSSGSRYNPAADAWSAMSTVNAPAPRAGDSGVWSGTEMIVWGGFDLHCELSCNGDCCFTLYNSGGRYNPVTDTWSPTSTAPGVPTPRDAPSAVWTGSRMIVWGGQVDAGQSMVTVTDTGGVYDPATDSWQPTAGGANLPEARSGASEAWTGSEMLVWGGGNDVTNLWNGGRYDPAAGTWIAMSAAGALHNSAPGVWTGSTFLFWGGLNDETGPFLIMGDGALYDPVTDVWTPTLSGPGIPYARANHAAVSDDGGIIVWGGLVEFSGDSFTDTGAHYCTCSYSSTYYRDLDADGYGDPDIPVTPCDGQAPAGYVPDAQDCNDADGSIHPGAPELCDGIDNDCDGSIENDSILSPIDGVMLLPPSTITWPPQGLADGYDVVLGSLNTLRSSGGDFTASTLTCPASNTPATSLVWIPNPAPGNGFWFLVRGRNCAGPATWDGEAGQVGLRDEEIAAAPGACP